MKQIGIIILVLGVGLGFYALSLDTSVSTSSLFGSSERVNNLGLMNAKTNYINMSGFLCVIGVILVAIDESKEVKATLLQKQNDYCLVQIRLLKKMLLNQGVSNEEVDKIIERGN